MIPAVVAGLRALLAGGQGVLQAARPLAARAGKAAKEFAQGATGVGGIAVDPAAAAATRAGMAGEAVRDAAGAGVDMAVQTGKNFVGGLTGAAAPVETVAGSVGGALRHTGLAAKEFAKANPSLTGVATGLAAPAIVAGMKDSESSPHALHGMALRESGDYEVYQDFLDGAKFPTKGRLSRREFETIRSNPTLLQQFAPEKG